MARPLREFARTWSLLNRFRTGQAHVVQTCTNGVSSSQLPVIVASDCRHVPISKI